MLQASGCSAEIDVGLIPFLPGTLDHARAGHKAGGLHANRRYIEGHLDLGDGVDPERVDLLCDPQTSGGLLIAVAPERSRQLADTLTERGISQARPVGRLLPLTGEGVRIRLTA
jgi:selenide,water dikinase